MGVLGLVVSGVVVERGGVVVGRGGVVVGRGEVVVGGGEVVVGKGGGAKKFSKKFMGCL